MQEHEASKSAAGPLAGVRILDLSAYIAGPYGATLLADQGADVIKIEPPEGDNLRKYPSSLEAESRPFLGVNRGKKGMSLNLKDPAGLAILQRLVKSADVLLHNFRPSVPPRLGIAYEHLREINPRLIYCAVTGYGETGPLKDKAGFDQVLQTMTGMCTFQGMDQGEPQLLYGSVVDYYAASLVAAGVASALYERERSGQGQFVGISLLRSALAMQSIRMIWAEGEPREIGRDMRSGGITGLHPTREGHIYLSANTPHFWTALCELAGLPPEARGERYDTVRKRKQHADEILPMLRAALQARSALEWEQVFGDAVPCTAVREVEDMFEHPQVLLEGMVTTMEHPRLGSYRGMQHPIKYGRSEPPSPQAAPMFGQHSREILESAGYRQQEIERLFAEGIVA